MYRYLLACWIVTVAACNAQENPGSDRSDPAPVTGQGSTRSNQPESQAGPNISDQLGAPSDWTVGTTDVTGVGAEMPTLADTRLGGHPGYDRLVLDFGDDELPGYHIEFIDRPVRQCGSGAPVELPGENALQIRLEPARAHSDEGKPSETPRQISAQLPIILEGIMVCDFEGQVEWVLATTRPNAYRVTSLTNPTRLILDLRH